MRKIGDSGRFPYFKTSFLKNLNLFRNLENHFLLKRAVIENVTYPYKLSGQKLMLRQIEWGAQNGPFAKNGVFSTNYFF